MNKTDLLDAVALGVDLFDCVLPTRNGRRGYLFTLDGVVRIAQQAHAHSDRPLEPECACEVCRSHSRGYLRHLFATEEHSATTLGALHNVTFLVELLRRARREILAGTFEPWKAAFLTRYAAGEQAWSEAHASNPEGAAGSRRARLAQQERRRQREGR